MSFREELRALANGSDFGAGGFGRSCLPIELADPTSLLRPDASS
jgi:hypothetical protein